MKFVELQDILPQNCSSKESFPKKNGNFLYGEVCRRKGLTVTVNYSLRAFQIQPFNDKTANFKSKSHYLTTKHH